MEEESKVKEEELKAKEMKIYYCMAGGRQFAVPEQFIIYRSEPGFIIEASKVFAIDLIPSVGMVASPRGQQATINVNITPLQNAIMDCNFICELSEGDPLYKEIRKQMEKS